jgi:hypothetical protein
MAAKTVLGLGLKTWGILALVGFIFWYIVYGSAEQDFIELLKLWGRQFERLLTELF